MAFQLNSQNNFDSLFVPAAVQSPNNPTINSTNYVIGQLWVNTVTQESWILVGFDGGQAVWNGTASSGGSGTFTSLTVNPGPTTLNGVTTINGTHDAANTIYLHENAGTAGTILIQSAQGTGAGSIELESLSGGIQIEASGAESPVAISSDTGAVTLVSGLDNTGAIVIQADGGTDTTLLIENTSGTASGSAITAAIGILATEGQIYIQSDLDANNAVTISAQTGDSAGIGILSNGPINISATTEDVGTISLTADDDADTAIALTASNVVGGITSTSGTGGFNVATSGNFSVVTSGTGAAQIFSDGFSVASTGAVSIASSTSTATLQSAEVLTITSTDAVSGAIVITTGIGGGGIQIGNTALTPNLDLGNVVPTVNRTTTIASGDVATAVTDTLNIGTGGVSANASADRVVNIASGNTATGSQIVNVLSGTAATGTATVNISTGTGGGTKAVNLGNVAGGTTITEYGTVNINTSTSTGTTTIGTVGHGGNVSVASLGTITLNSADTTGSDVIIESTGAGGGVAINGGVSTGSTAIGNNTNGAAVSITSNTAGANAITLDASNATGGITATVATSGFNVTGGNLAVTTAAKGVLLPGSVAMLSGAGTPSGSVSAAQGSFFLRTDGSTDITRAYINTDGGTTWTAINTVG
ncbi:hypothetical protein UFOVP97_32 [uncultured Caudovirales phage]|uniref:Uncharacterized protein n=1 Tax=uncultured Caudovirales phage TaxID=2100421 RepID=A0A6J5LLL8_9CAUD|nr:hypothetical protein UFOVP97_32 [uncultured Caudovirales phage]CAB4134372.1 hypothetical protein UFOVP268_50 [uncultured Caudovirales phage]